MILEMTWMKSNVLIYGIERGYTYDVIAEEFEFLESKNKDDKPEPEYNEPEDPFADFGDNIEITDDDLPF